MPNRQGDLRPRERLLVRDPYTGDALHARVSEAELAASTLPWDRDFSDLARASELLLAAERSVAGVQLQLLPLVQRLRENENLVNTYRAEVTRLRARITAAPPEAERNELRLKLALLAKLQRERSRELEREKKEKR